MRRYEFRAIDRDGQTKDGNATAQDEEELLAKLREMNLTVIDLKEAVEKPQASAASGEKSLSFDFGVSQKDVTFFTRQLAITLSAGLPLARIFSTLYNQTSSKSLKKVISVMGNDLQQGLSLSETMKKHPRIFDSMYLSMVAVGETSGALPATIRKLADLMEKDAAVKRKIRSALAYPVFIIIFSVILSYALLAMLMPGFEPVFNSTGLDLAQDYPLTHLLMKLSALLTNPVVVGVIIVLLVGILAGLKFALTTPRGRYLFDSLKFNFPFLCALVRTAAATRFCHSFATLTESGVPLLKALSLVGQSSGNEVMSRAVDRMAREIQEGTRLSEAMKRSGVFPELVVQMVSIGEEAGSLPEMFDRTAEYFDSELESAVDSLTAMMEPAMMVFVGLIVGVFVMGILLPIMGIASRI
ncbi:MAG: type II secretion system F family protein [bacterium]